MKIITTLFSFISVITISAQTFNAPESVQFDGANHRWLVGNNGTGTVSSDYPNSATAIPFSTGTPMSTGPHGIEILNGVVYCCDGANLQGYNITTGASVFSMNLGATFLNGITSDGVNYLFVTDFSAKKIYRVCPATNSFNVMRATVKTPNGIIYDGANNRCVFCTWGSNAPIQAISLADSMITTLSPTTLSNCDGITFDHAGYWYVSAWGNNSLNRFSPTFTSPTVVMSGLSSPADICINTNGDSIGIPNNGGSTVVFYTNITTGIFANDEIANATVFPNPAKDRFTINFSENVSCATIQLFSTDGKCVSETQVNGLSAEIETAELENGFYLLLVMDSNQNLILRKKILVCQ